MDKFLLLALDWSEVWALLIPLIVLLLHRKQPATLKPVIIYLWVALALNLVIDVIMGFNVYFDSIIESNNPYYNIHSLIRFGCFSIYFIKLPYASFLKFRKLLLLLFVLFVVANFIFFEDFFNPEHLSGNLMAAESYLLLVYCLQYYLSELKSDRDDLFNRPDFWVVTGLGMYVVVNFFVFLFYVPMLRTNIDLAIDIWNVHNIAFIIFCIFITKAFYAPAGNKFAN
jgi:hypothetical protein